MNRNDVNLPVANKSVHDPVRPVEGLADIWPVEFWDNPTSFGVCSCVFDCAKQPCEYDSRVA